MNYLTKKIVEEGERESMMKEEIKVKQITKIWCVILSTRAFVALFKDQHMDFREDLRMDHCLEARLKTTSRLLYSDNVSGQIHICVRECSEETS